jgi:2-dehydropantoate 2-reductase
VEEFIKLFDNTGITATLSDNIVQSMWDKWTVLATMAAGTCLMGATIGEIVRTNHGEAFLSGLYNECSAIATSEGSRPDAEALKQSFRRICNRDSIAKASMCRDMEGGGPTEADHVIGDLIERAKRHQIETPLLAAAYTRLMIYETKRHDMTS